MIVSYNFPFKWISPFSLSFPFKWAFINASQHILISSIKLLQSAPSKKKKKYISKIFFVNAIKSVKLALIMHD